MLALILLITPAVALVQHPARRSVETTSGAAQLSEDDIAVWFDKERVERRSLAEMHGAGSNWVTSGPESLGFMHMDRTQANARLDCETLSQRTYLQSSRCPINHGAPRPTGLLVTGVGRSGSAFLAKLLGGLGLYVAHDNTASRGKDGSVSWIHGIRETQQCQVPDWSYHVDQDFSAAVLLVREPLKQVASRSNGGKNWPSAFPECLTAMDSVGKLMDDGLSQVDAVLVNSAMHYVLWNSFVLKYASSIIRVEDIAENHTHVTRLCDVMRPNDHECTSENIGNLITVMGKKVNSAHTLKTEGVTWSRLAQLNKNTAIMMQKLAIEVFGYKYAEAETFPEVKLPMPCQWNEEGKWACRLVGAQ